MTDMIPATPLHTAMIECRTLIHALQRLIGERAEDGRLEIIPAELYQLFGAVDSKIEIAITVLEKEGQEAAAAKPEVEELDSEASIVIEPNAALEVSTAYARKLAGAVREAGLTCDTISAAHPLSGGNGYQLSCNRFKFDYGIHVENGRWMVISD